MVPTTQKKLIVVLGMNRNGTSTITRSLKVLGVELGNNLMPAISGNNDKGFWEDLDIYQLNVDLLTAINHDWDNLLALPQEIWNDKIIQDFKPTAISLLRSKFDVANVFGIKDPRIARLLPFWQSVFDDLKIDVSYVIASRNPLSVTASLEKRDNLQVLEGCYLWADYLFCSLAHVLNKKYLVVDYDLLLQDSVKELSRMATALNLEFDPFDSVFKEYQQDFIDFSLRHTEYTLTELFSDSRIPVIVKSLYQLCYMLASDNNALKAPQLKMMLKKIKLELNSLMPVLHHMQNSRDTIRAMQTQLHEFNSELNPLKQKLEQQDNQVSTLTLLLDDCNHKHKADQELLLKQQTQLASLQTVNSDQDSVIVQLNSKLRDSCIKYDELELLITNSEAELAVAYQSLDNLKQISFQLHSDLGAIRSSMSWHITKPIRYFNTVFVVKISQLMRNIRH